MIGKLKLAEAFDYRSNLLFRTGSLIQDIIDHADWMQGLDSFTIDNIRDCIRILVSIRHFAVKSEFSDITANPFLVAMIERAVFNGIFCLQALKSSTGLFNPDMSQVLSDKRKELIWLSWSISNHLKTSHLKNLTPPSDAAGILLQHVSNFLIESFEEDSINVTLNFSIDPLYNRHDVKSGVLGTAVDLNWSGLARFAKARSPQSEIDIARGVKVTEHELGFTVFMRLPKSRVLRERMIFRIMYISVKALGSKIKKSVIQKIRDDGYLKIAA